jgi:hypothetical protein
MLATAPLRSHLNHAVVTLARFQHGPAFINCPGQRFFDVNILASLRRHYHRQRMPVVWRRNENDVHVLSVQDAAEILHRVRLFAPFLLANLCAGEEEFVIDVANDGAIDLRIEEEAFQIALAHAAAANQAQPNLVIGPRLAGPERLEERGTHCSRGHTGGGCAADEFSSSYCLHIKACSAKATTALRKG